MHATAIAVRMVECRTAGENVSTSPVLNNKVLLWYRYAGMLATCYYTRSPYCCCVATIVHTGDQLPDPRLVSRALISREALALNCLRRM